METDSYYEIGSSHKVCQDYCISIEEDKIAYAILSDGCSSSKDSAIGACLLSITAKSVISHLKDRMSIRSSSYISTFSSILISKIKDIQSSLNISSYMLDATLLVNIIEKETFLCFGWGDGFFISKDTDDNILIKDISYYDEAPYYPSYDIDPTRKSLYQLMYSDKSVITRATTCLDNEGGYRYSNCIQINNPFSPVLIAEGDKVNIKSITLCSDGLKTYYKKDDKEKKKLNTQFIIPKILDYKSTKGEFVTRRMSRLKKEMIEAQIQHSDDISCTTIIL